TYFPVAFEQGSHHLKTLLGTIETVDLLTSSLTMVIAIHFARAERRGLSGLFLGPTMGLGLALLALHSYECPSDYVQGALPGRYYHSEHVLVPGASIFYTCYFFLTGLHSIHVIAGVGVLGWMLRSTVLGRYSSAYHTPVEMAGLYWHLVDLIWVFLFPMF